MVRSRIVPAGPLLALLGLSACGDDTSARKDDDGGALSSASKLACELPRSDGGAGACLVARYAVECTNASGGCSCLSDDPNVCSECPLSKASCHSLCAKDEYAISCGGPPRFNTTTPYESAPAACRVLASFPSGGVYSCCPC
jgi:hypothetical protein